MSMLTCRTGRLPLLAGATIFALAACSSPGSGTAAPFSTSSVLATTAPVHGTAAVFISIIEPFDPGHPARTRPDPGNCGDQQTTLGLEQCYETRTENTDAQIDTAQVEKYRTASTARQAAILAQDRAWLAARGPVCAAAFSSGGTIDGVNIASCLLDESTARLDAVTGVTPPQAVLRQTDSLQLDRLYWYTTPGGSRIAMKDTQGDEAGGAVIAWVIIGGAQGFVVNPAQFCYSDGSFTDAGIVELPGPLHHRVATGAVYQFRIDYSRLSADPDKAGGAGGYVYAPGGVTLAAWR